MKTITYSTNQLSTVWRHFSLVLILLLMSTGISFAQEGNTCITPIVITELPYTNSGNTSAYGDDYELADVPPVAPGAITNGTTSYGYYIGGDDVVFAITPVIDGQITINTTNDNDWIGLLAFTGCPFASTVGYHTATSGATRSIPNLPVLANVTYYIVISTWPTPQSTNFTINIDGTPGLLAPLEACDGTPTGGVVTVNPATNNPGASYTVAASGYTTGLDLTYQWQYSEDNGGTWTNAGTAGEYAAYTAIAPEELGSVVIWRLEVYCENSDETSISQTATFTTGLVYCTSVPTSNDNSGITNVAVGLTNIQVGDVFYYDYTGAPASISAGTVVPASVTFATGYSYHCNIWIDLNDNGVFDATELVFQGESTNANPTTLNTSFPLPADAPLGVHKMRIGTADAGQATPNPCYSGSYGVTVDLNVEVTDPPVCLAPTNLSTSFIGLDGTLTWTEPNGSDGNYEYVISTTNGTPSVNGTAVSGASVELNDLEEGNTYYVFVRSNCGNDGYSTWTMTSFFVGYCQVTSTSTTYGISNFTTTGGFININNTTGPGAYNNYSANYFVSQYAGGAVNFSITSASGTTGMGIWIDWNNNYIFEASEKVYSSAGYVANGTGTILVPEGTANGNYRMRVVANYLSTNPTACGDLGSLAYGEAEDYTFMISDPPACLPVTSVSAAVSGTSATVTWPEPSTSSGNFEYIVSTSNQAPTEAGTPISGTTVTVEDLIPGNTYYAFVRMDCGNDGYSLWVSTSFYIGYCQVTSTNTSTYGISNFTTTGGYVNINNTTGSGTYTDYSATQFVSQSAGESVNFSMTSSGGTTGLGIWIDWNNDLDFNDAGEQVYASGGYVSSGSGTITVPTGTPMGSYRMRIVANGLSTTPTPCGNLGYAGYGEAEDYNFVVSEPPACMPVTNVTSVLSITTATINWTEPSPTSGNYEYVVSTSSQAPTEAGTPISGTTVTVEDLIPGNTYYAFVRMDCGNDGYSFWVGTSFYVGYCQVISGSTTTYGISNFSTTEGFTNINNTSGANAYTDYTSQSVSTYQGGEVNFTITGLGTNTYGMGIWIDWNNNYEFEASEQVYASGATYISVGTGSITVPVNTPLGNYRMRVVANYLSTNPTPCGNLGSTGYGEAEDYTFVVTDPPACAPPIGLVVNLSGTTVNITWDELSSPSEGYEYVISTVSGTPNQGDVSVVDLSLTEENLLEGNTYYVYIRSNCGDGDYSTWATASFYVGYCQVTSTNTSYGISNFTTTEGFTNINNTSGPGTYTDYSSQSVSTYPGGMVGFSITSVGSSTHGMGIWVDWNNNYLFEANEQVFSSNGEYLSVGTGNITAPIGTPLGSYRMRVVANWLSTNPTPCGDTGYAGYGEAEDYTFIVTDPPACPPPVGLVVNTNGTSVTITWNELSVPSEGYQYVISTVNEAPVAGAQTTDSPTLTENDLAIGNWYYAFIRANCGDGEYSTWATISFYIGYCLPTTNYVGDYISNFQTQGALIDVNFPSTGGSPYTDNSSMVITEHIGGEFNFSVTYVGGSNGVNIWIDWNNDMTFDDTENVYYASGSSATKTGAIAIPMDAQEGLYHMRVRAQYGTEANPPACGEVTFGEAEDYTLQVVEMPSCLPPTGLTAGATSLTEATISWNAPVPSSNGYEYFISPTIGTPTETGTGVMETSVDVDGLTFGTYYVYVRTNCGEEDGYSLWTGPAIIHILEGDDPCTAVALPISGECVFNTYTTQDATDSANPNIPVPGCAGYQGGDVWFTVIVPANGHVIVDAIQGSLTDCGMAWYTGDNCNGQLTLLECDDDDSDNGLMPRIEREGLEPFSTLYIRFWKYGTPTGGTFGICATTPCTAPGMPTITTVGNTASISWPSAGEGAEYNWEIRLSGAAGSGNDGLVQSGTTDADVTTLEIIGLDFATTYLFFVSTNCGDGVSSAWSNGTDFTTEVMQGCTDPAACNYNQDAMIDDGSCTYETTVLYADTDGDGFGDPDNFIDSCGATEGYVEDNTDCDDSDATVWRTGEFYIDADGDGYDNGQETICYGEDTPSGYIVETLGHDCDDSNPDSWAPTALEVTLQLPITSICQTSASFTLTGGSPAGGIWSGSGVVGSSFNPNTAGVGVHTITYTVNGDGICTLSGNATADITVEVCPGINEDGSDAITLYPTVTNNHVTIVGNGLSEAIIMDMSGKHLKTVSLFKSSEVDMQSFSSGIYFIHVSSNTNSAMFRVVKVN